MVHVQLNKIMKQIKTSIQFSILIDGKIQPQSFKLKVKLREDSVGGLTFKEWIQRLIQNKLVIPTEFNTAEFIQRFEPYYEGIFVAKNSNPDYLLTQIEFMLNTLINENLIEFIYERID